MAVPIAFIAKYAIPLIVAALFLGDGEIPEQFRLFDKTLKLTDEVLSKGRGEGESTPEFDYIIVGGGTAGLILANRLTASGQNSVLVLEAGGDPNPILDVPYAQRFFWNSDMDWAYRTVKQEKTCQVPNMDGYCWWPRGKGLGGSSSVNGLVYNRCKPKDYDSWANFTGDQSWSWQNVKETYNKIEDYHGFFEETAGADHGSGGEMYVGSIDYIPGVEVMEEALREKGIPYGGDLNGGEDFTYGFAKVDYNIKNGMRWGTYQAFLEPILNRTNLVIYRYAYVTKVVTTSAGGGVVKAVGVNYERHGVTRTALASKEVIMAAGVVESPKILMLSGIGPKEHLDEMNITTILDLPVGKYLQEHPGLDVVGSNGGFRLNTTFGKDYNTSDSVLQFLYNGTGPMNGFAYDDAYAPQIMMGYLTSKQNPDKSRPDAHVYIHEMYKPAPDNTEEFYFSLELVQLNTWGTIKLASADPKDKPVIDPNFFEDENDFEKMIDVIEQMVDVFVNSTTFRKYGIQQLGVFDKCKDEEFGTRAYWKCIIIQRSFPYFHPTSTCRMGPNATVAVVDSKMKVFGTQNLRVIDSSTMPFAPSGNTNLPTMLIAARGAEVILSGE